MGFSRWIALTITGLWRRVLHLVLLLILFLTSTVHHLILLLHILILIVLLFVHLRHDAKFLLLHHLEVGVLTLANLGINPINLELVSMHL